VQAKNDPISALQRALRTGRCELRAESYATELVLDAAGRRATGVRYLDLSEHPEPSTREVRARHAVVLAAGAFETPRLLLRQGLGVTWSAGSSRTTTRPSLSASSLPSSSPTGPVASAAAASPTCTTTW
jgi:choline dehydrogenase-like flavoprotein